MKKFLLNSVGSTLVNALIAGAAVAAGGVYMMSTMQQQKTVSKSAAVKGIHSLIRREISENLSDGTTCLSTMNWGATNDLPAPDTANNNHSSFAVTDIRNAAGTVLYDSTTVLYNHRISNIKFEVDDYQEKPGYHFQDSYISFLVESIDPKLAGRTIRITIPLFTMLTDKKITSCLSNDAGSVADVYASACQALGGSYQEGEGLCLGLHGANSNLFRYLQDYFCSSSPSTCDKLPLAGKSCVADTTRTARNLDYDNWVVAGININGQLRCECIPLKSCPDKTLYCSQTDLGTDGCYTDCGFGSKTDGACAPCTATSWQPAANAVCAGKSFTQVSNCGGTQPAVGTMAEVFTPAPADVCAGQSYTAYSNCGNSLANQMGTKNCSCPLTLPRTWSQTISGNTYNCTDGGSGTVTLQDGEYYVATTPTGATNSGMEETLCNDGQLFSVRRSCNPLPKTMDCHLYYKLSFDDSPGAAQDGNWIVIKNGARENCGSSGCFMTVGVACPNSDAEVKVSYAMMINNWTGTVDTPWSGTDGNIQWGPSVRIQTGNDDECGGNGCGVQMSVQTRGGGTCTIDYGWGIENIRRTASNGAKVQFYCTNKKGSPTCEEHGCNEGNGCGMMAKLNCSI